MGKIDYKMMDKFVNEECHLIINALSKDSFSKCNIPGSINIPLLSLKRNPKDPKKSENIELAQQLLDDINSKIHQDSKNRT